MKLTKRELWLMDQAYRAGLEEIYWDERKGLKEYLAEVVDDHGHTVEEQVAGMAPKEEANE